MNTFELYGSNREDLIEIDDLIAPTIQLLNRKNYITSASCSGHAEREPSNGYIQFDFGEMTPEILPKGWYWEADGLMYYEYISSDEQLREKEICDVMKMLYEWAENLPDAH